MEKPLHSQFMRKKDKEGSQEASKWLKTKLLKKETQEMLMAAKNQTLRTNCIRRKVEETISHGVAECKIIVQKQYCIWRHDRVGVIVHWVMFKR